MARFAPLVWAVPITLAVLMLARSALQPAAELSPAGQRVGPAIVRHLVPPGRLHAPDDARPVATSRTSDRYALGAAPVPGSLERTQPADVIGPRGSDQAQQMELPPYREALTPRPTAATRRPASSAPTPGTIYYPITEASNLPPLADAWPGTAGRGAGSQRLPGGSIAAVPGRTVAPPAGAISPPASSQTLSSVHQQAAAMNQRAVKLAQRGALYSARAELLEALRLVAQAHDVQEGQARRATALAAGLAAMEESEDFSGSSSLRRTQTPLADIIRPHVTPVLKNLDTTRLSALAASQHYLAYAQQQLSAAAGSEAVAAQSLYLLGKVHTHLAAESAAAGPPHTARAIVFHQSALAANPRHYQAANELGVLLARFGELKAARQALLTSVTEHPTNRAWNNLAAIHERLGDTDLARRARYEAQLLGDQSPRTAGGPSVQWIDPATFAAQSPPAGEAPAGKTVQAAAATSSSTRPAALRR